MTDPQLIQQKIFEIRGLRVMLDFDLAALYGVETRRLNEQVKRNIDRFPEDFMFQLTKDELEILRARISERKNWISQNATSNSVKMGLRKLPYAFTEHGVAMLSSVIRSPLAIQTNISIIRAFVAFRRMTTALPLPDNYAELRAEIQAVRNEMNEILADQNDINESTRAQLDAISAALAELQAKEPHRHTYRPIGFIQHDE